MKRFMKQGGGIVAVSLLFAVLSLGAKPGMAFGYGYGHETPEEESNETVTPAEDSTKQEVKKEENKRSGKKYREYKEYREKYKAGRLTYLKLRSYKKSDNPLLAKEFTDRQALYQTYRGWSKAQLEAANISDATLLKYLEYKQYHGYKKYKELRNDLDI